MALRHQIFLYFLTFYSRLLYTESNTFGNNDKLMNVETEVYNYYYDDDDDDYENYETTVKPDIDEVSDLVTMSTSLNLEKHSPEYTTVNNIVNETSAQSISLDYTTSNEKILNISESRLTYTNAKSTTLANEIDDDTMDDVSDLETTLISLKPEKNSSRYTTVNTTANETNVGEIINTNDEIQTSFISSKFSSTSRSTSLDYTTNDEKILNNSEFRSTYESTTLANDTDNEMIITTTGGYYDNEETHTNSTEEFARKRKNKNHQINPMQLLGFFVLTLVILISSLSLIVYLRDYYFDYKANRERKNRQRRRRRRNTSTRVVYRDSQIDL